MYLCLDISLLRRSLSLMKPEGSCLDGKYLDIQSGMDIFANCTEWVTTFTFRLTSLVAL